MLAGLLNVSMMWLINGEGEGLDGSEDAVHVPADVSALLAEVRGLREDLSNSAKKAGRLEKRLREMLKEAGDA